MFKVTVYSQRTGNVWQETFTSNRGILAWTVFITRHAVPWEIIGVQRVEV